MTSNPKTLVLPRDQRSLQEFSFIEALNLGDPRESLSLVSKEQLGLPPSPGAPTTQVRPDIATIASSSSDIGTPRTTSTNPRSGTVKSGKTPKMAPISKAQTQCIELCNKTTKLGDRISIHMLEYLSSVKQLPDGLDALAHGVLDTCEVLFALEAGFDECTKRRQPFPQQDLLSELDKKLRVTQADFQLLDQHLSKFLEYERKGKMGRMKRGWDKLFGDTDFDKMATTLTRAREMLRMSVLMFHWSLDTDKSGSTVGIGYTGLAAALDRLDQRAGMGKAITSEDTLSQHHLPVAATPRGIEALQPPLPPLPWSERSSSFNHEPTITAPSLPDSRQPLVISPRQYSATTASSIGSHERVVSGTHGTFDRTSAFDETLSNSGTNESDGLLEDIAGIEIGASKIVRLTPDPFSMPRWTPRNVAGPDNGHLRAGLVSAVRAKNHKLVEQLLDRGGLPSAGPEGHPLREAIRAHDSESLRLLLLFGAEPNQADKDGMTPLLAAVEESFLGAAVALVRYGADPNQASAGHESPLAAGAIANKVSISHLLLIYGGEVNHTTSEGDTLLTSAINKKTPKAFIDLLLEYGANPNAKGREGKTALFEAIQASRADIVASLIEHGANVNLPGPKHMLWPATYKPQCLQILLSHGADFKKCPGILELATSINNIDSVRILIKAGVDINAKKDQVYTPLCTSIRDDLPDIFHLLLSKGANPNVMASEYPAFKCITHNRVHYLPALLAAGADLRSPKGILETAVSHNNMEALIWLLDQGLDPDERNPKGQSALSSAIKNNRIDMVDLLIARGADANQRGEDWPINMAVRNPTILKRILAVLPEPRAFKGVVERAVVANQLESVQLLLQANVSVEDKNGGVFSPLTSGKLPHHPEAFHR